VHCFTILPTVASQAALRSTGNRRLIITGTKTKVGHGSILLNPIQLKFQSTGWLDQSNPLYPAVAKTLSVWIQNVFVIDLICTVNNDNLVTTCTVMQWPTSTKSLHTHTYTHCKSQNAVTVHLTSTALNPHLKISLSRQLAIIRLNPIYGWIHSVSNSE